MWNSFLRNGLGSTECLWWKINLDPKPQSRKGLCTKHKKIVKSNRKIQQNGKIGRRLA